ncbi:putative phage tail protein [Dongia soli]|uniref:Phage tail protein n=1 Tax=Dongia soli TaxID=600628 RepID=A0ABU5E7N2_9PROT|nr:putative phage tail protein [Dongia soli]MDY0882316.1 putative phage tail protein [Dongia soli]
MAETIDPLCGLTNEDFGQLALDLLPQGFAWPRDEDTVLWSYWMAATAELRRHHDRSCDLLERESFPCASQEMLGDWERSLGLPDACTPAGLSIRDRQIALCLKLAERGLQTPAFFIHIAAVVGFEIEVIEHFPPRAGIVRAGCFRAAICPYWWSVRVLNQTVRRAAAGCFVAGAPVCELPNLDLLRCVIRRAAPAHTIVTFEIA